MKLDYVMDIKNFSGGIHLVGIGGTGMSGIAQILLSLNCQVQGSDVRENEAVKRLRALGAEISIGHKEENIANAKVLVVSSAIASDNPEVQAAQAARIPIIKRAEMLAELMRFRFGIAIAGTHGKTTTTSLVASVLSEAGLDPTYVIGGKVERFGHNAILGKSKYLVAEADESDGSFLHLNPILAVVTNIENDHLSAYQQDFQILVSAFTQFLENLPFYGIAIVCNEDATLRQLQKQVPRRFLTYGFTEDCDIYAHDIKFESMSSQFQLSTSWSNHIVQLHLNLPGKHNVLNALAAFGIGHVLQLNEADIYNTFKNFQGISRRFQNCGDIQSDRGMVTIIDDYAHHPTEIAATYDAACTAWPERRKIVIFQPHRYTRVQALFNEFADVLASVDELIMLKVYAAGEQPIEGADGISLHQAVSKLDRNHSVYVEDLEQVPEVLEQIVQDQDVIIMMGAGSINTLAKRVIQRMENRHAA